MSRKYFGTDGVRGTVGESPMTPDFVMRLGYAAGKVLSGKDKHPAVLIGKDTRISGYMVESALEAEMDKPMGCNQAAGLGKVRRREDAGSRYIEFCKSTFPNELDLKGMKIVVDCAHGAAYAIAPSVFHELGAEVTAIGVKPDGMNINEQFG